MRVLRLSSGFLIAVALLGTVGPARGQGEESDASGGGTTEDSPAPVTVRDVAAFYRTARFDDCVRAARRLLDADDPSHVEEQSDIDAATTYLGTCLVRTGHQAEAVKLFEQWIFDGARHNAIPSRPNLALYGAAAAEAYDLGYQRASARLDDLREAALAARRKAKQRADERDRAEVARQRALLEFASTETVITRNRRWLATVPFGVGQFQNGKPGLGWLFLTSETLALGVTLGGLAAEIEFATHAPLQADNAREAQNPGALATGAGRARVTWVTGMYVFAALAAGGIVEAHLNFVPQFEEQRQREVPKELREPVKSEARVRFAPVRISGGTGFGVVGRF